jgi:hypothetical protein
MTNPTSLQLEPFEAQRARWPARGRHILAQSDDDAVVVYQAYRPDIARFAVAEQRFGGPFSFTRMSWIKPNFLWMMFRSGWATKEGQEHVLAIRFRRAAFFRTLGLAVHSSYDADRYGSRDHWRERLQRSEVRLQWDPDHGLHGEPLERRAIQLGLAGETLRAFAEDDVVGIEDITPFVHAQRALVRAGAIDQVMVPREAPLAVDDAALRLHLGLDDVDAG